VGKVFEQAKILIRIFIIFEQLDFQHVIVNLDKVYKKLLIFVSSVAVQVFDPICARVEKLLQRVES
jgi:hypothetical protein